MSQFCTYIHRDSEGAVFYVGKGVNRRPYYKSGRSKAWRERAANGFNVEIVKDGISDAAARELEAELIATHRDTIVNVRARDNSKITENPKALVSLSLNATLVDEVNEWVGELKKTGPMTKTWVYEEALRLFRAKYIEANPSGQFKASQTP